MEPRRRMRRAWLVLLLSLLVIAARDQWRPDAVELATAAYRFPTLLWHVQAVPEAVRLFFVDSAPDGSAQPVEEYFALLKRISAQESAALVSARGRDEWDLLNSLRRERDARAGEAARLIAAQVQSVIADAQLGLEPPLLSRIFPVFPPVAFTFAEPPRLLVISPRQRIELVRHVALRPDISLEEVQGIEQAVERTGVSALVVGLGGYASYPASIPFDLSLEDAVEAITHEWVHHYLAFRPLGRAYDGSPALRTINETVANIVGRELASQVLARFYGRSTAKMAAAASNSTEGFSVGAFLRETRLGAEALLAEGRIAEAESFMETRRQELLARGYRIRRLNQAYFAFHGAYADGPHATDPLGEQLRVLRSQAPSLRAFLEAVAHVTDPEALYRLSFPR